MKRTIIWLFSLQGTIGRLAYFLAGVLAFAIKYTIDRFAASLLHHSPWMPWQYLNPLRTTVSLLSLSPDDRRFLLVMAAIALPFVWLGVALTVKRLRALRMPAALVLLFFVPAVSLGLFFCLCILPTQQVQAGAGSVAQRAGAVRISRVSDSTLALVISIPICLAAAWLATRIPSYGLGLFVALPFCLGLLSVLIYTWRRPYSYGQCLGVGMAACGIVSLGLLVFALEGIICLMMAAPIAIGLAALGASLGYVIQSQTYRRWESAAMLVLLAAFPPAIIGSEGLMRTAAPEFAVRSAIEVNAPPERVWKQVVEFSQLPEPAEWLFRAGIAYPIRAEIHGRGAGAIRYCIFSTGPFVEPITTWDEPRLLEFSVSRVPAPMRELSPYGGLHPPHLDGFLVSHKGRFELTPLPGGRTRLEGVTWYSHDLWPASYWRLWSNYIIHRIHLRVLEHIEKEAEAR